jgi:DNA-binding HxlR family transcriptional regulator
LNIKEKIEMTIIKKVAGLEKALQHMGKKFDLLIIESIASNKSRTGFNQILKDIPSINPRTLSTRLKSMEANKLITKSLVLGTPVKTEYTLTEKAEQLLPIINQIKHWAEKNKVV